MDAAVVICIGGDIVEWNQRAEELFGWTRAESIGKEFGQIALPQQQRSAFCKEVQSLASNARSPQTQTSTRTLTAVRRDGEEFTCDVAMTGVTHEGDFLAVCFLRDKTDEVKMQQRLARQTLEIRLLQQATLHATERDSFEEALQTSLDTLCEMTGWPIGHVYVVDEGTRYLRSSGVWHLDDPVTFEAFRTVTEETEVARGEGFAGRIWESGEPDWVSDIYRDRNIARDTLTRDLKVHSAFGFPVKIDDEILAVMEFFSPNEIVPDPQILAMLNSISAQLGRMMERRWLQQEQTRQSAIVDSSADAIISRALDGAITSWNEGAEELYGYSADEAIEGGVGLILPVGIEKEDGKILRAVRAGHRVDQFESKRRRKDGEIVSVSVAVSPILDADGQVIGSSMVERNITELVETRQELQATEQHSRLLLESTAEAIYGIDLDGNCTFCNPSCVQMLGYDSADELLGRNMHRCIHHTRPDGSPYANEECRIYLAFRQGEGSHVDDEVLWRKDGTAFPAEYWSYPISRDGETVGAVVTFIDITERKQAEVGYARLASVVDSSVDAIIATDPDGVINHWNRGAESVYGYSEDEAIGKSLAFLLPPNLAAEDSVVLKAIRDGDELKQFETARARKDGTIIDVAITVSPIRMADRRLVGASSIERDITVRRRRERDLEQARDAAESANRAKSEFLANISHELRTPMNAIIGMTDLALREDLTPDVHDCLLTAKDSADTLLFLLNDILDFSRMEAGRFELEPIDFNIRSMLNDAVKSLSLRAHEAGLELACHVDYRVPYWLHGDSLRLRQIVTNLVTNALKFTDQGEVLLEVTSETENAKDLRPGDDLVLHVAVKDTGIGISEADQKMIFAPFTQADASTTRRYSGTGLGLSICRKLTTLMGGRMWVESELGKGSTFHVTVGFTVASDSDDTLRRSRLTAGSLESLPVLIVDDNKTNQRILAEMLKNWSMSPTICDSANQAYEKLASAADSGEPYPLIIVDALMPQVDGFMLIEKINLDPKLKRATILMLSSADRQMFRDRCSTLPISSYLEKPISQSDLLDAIMTALEGPQYVTRASETLGASNRPLRILCAEDTPANQKVITKILSKRGHRVEIAHNGREAVDRSQREQFDLIIMDVQMPTMDGLQATKLIRENERETKRHVPVVAMTAHAMRGDREKCIDAGMDDYLTKPIDAERLIRKVESIAGAISDHTTGVATALEPVSASASADALWDPDIAINRLGGDKALLLDMIGFFLEDAPGLLDTMVASINSADHSELARAAHSMKGLCSNFEATEATQAALAIQQHAEQVEIQEAKSCLEKLKHDLQLLSDQLTRYAAAN